MLAKIAPTSADFHTLARYLLEGKPGTQPDPKRVAWTISQNLPTDDPLLAATYMTATAEQSQRVQKAVYHLMIAWHQRERPSPEAMHTIALRTLELAGLAEHQALIMGHGDKPHEHLHIMLNRVHPETGRAWSTAHDYQRFDAIMRQLADDHGFRHTPAHAFNAELTDALPSKPNSKAHYAAKRGAPTQRLKWSKAASRAFGAYVSEELTPASTLEDIAFSLAGRGLELERKGRGLVAGNAQSYATFSSLGLSLSAFSKRRLHNVFAVDAVDIARALLTLGLASRGNLKSAIADADHRRQERIRALPLPKQLSSDLRHALSATTSLAPSDKHLAKKSPAKSASREMSK